MKNVRFLSILAGLWGLLAIAPATMAQDVSINLLASPASLPQSTTGSIRVDVCNTDAANTPAVASALQPQITVGPNVKILGVTALDGSPLTTFSVLSKTDQVIKLSNSAALANGGCLSFKIIIQGVTIDSPGGGGLITGVLGFGGSAPAGNQSFNDTSTSSVSVVAPVLPDLTPVIYVRPTVVYGTAPVSVVVSVIELNSVALNGTIQVRISRDPALVLSFDGSAVTVSGRPVQNSLWSFSATNPSYYELTALGGVGADGVLSFGLNGTLSGGSGTGELSVSAGVLSSVAEQTMANNNASGRIGYFAAIP